MLSYYLDPHRSLGGHCLHLSLLKAEHPWLVIIHYGHSALAILSLQDFSSLWVVELDEEILIRLPVIFVNDLDFDLAFRLTLPEFEDLVNCLVVLLLLCISILCPDAYFSSFFGLV